MKPSREAEDFQGLSSGVAKSSLFPRTLVVPRGQIARVLAIPLGDLSGNVARSPVSVAYDEYQKVKARKRRLSYAPPPRLAKAALSAGGLSSISLTSTEIMSNRNLLQVRASAKWELMKECLEKRIDHWNQKEEYRGHLFLSGGFNHRSESFSRAATPRSVIGSRFSERPPF
ncbi:hypothetical protein F2Q68_00021112 [Brassica cretica]|uniref:Uncharacterized protein n=1 Tax=Brassica cretica TaxID=69181 RepID=A0A8S9G191_BRACR|nr:hypothetical protein F2Q68_00021112 [Brassica cretica]